MRGILAEFADPGTLVTAARSVREAGLKRWDSYSPFPVHGIDGAMGIRPTVLPWLVLGAGITGGVGRAADAVVDQRRELSAEHQRQTSVQLAGQYSGDV